VEALAAALGERALALLYGQPTPQLIDYLAASTAPPRPARHSRRRPAAPEIQVTKLLHVTYQLNVYRVVKT
jgi:hypothetical protein